MNHVELSQVNFGLIMRGDTSPQNYISDTFFGAYADAVAYMQTHPEWEKEDLYLNNLITPDFVQSAEHITSSLNGEGESTDWPLLLKQRSEDEQLREFTTQKIMESFSEPQGNI